MQLLGLLELLVIQSLAKPRAMRMFASSCCSVDLRAMRLSIVNKAVHHNKKIALCDARPGQL